MILNQLKKKFDTLFITLFVTGVNGKKSKNVSLKPAPARSLNMTRNCNKPHACFYTVTHRK